MHKLPASCSLRSSGQRACHKDSKRCHRSMCVETNCFKKNLRGYRRAEKRWKKGPPKKGAEKQAMALGSRAPCHFCIHAASSSPWKKIGVAMLGAGVESLPVKSSAGRQGDILTPPAAVARKSAPNFLCSRHLVPLGAWATLSLGGWTTLSLGQTLKSSALHRTLRPLCEEDLCVHPCVLLCRTAAGLSRALGYHVLPRAPLTSSCSH